MSMVASVLTERERPEVQEMLNDDPRWLLVQRIVVSSHFSKGVRLADFLQFVAEATLTGHAEELNEQYIGVNVFERRMGYNSAEDNIVRSHASRLRQKLDAYFLDEGRAEPLRVHLPRGSYVPHFEAAPAIAELASLPVSDEPALSVKVADAAKPKNGLGSVAISTWVLAIALAIMSTFALYEWHNGRVMTQSLQSSSPVIHELWKEVFPPDKRTLIVPADSTLVIYKDLTGMTTPLQAYMNKDYLVGAPAILPRTTADIGKWVARRRLTSVADIEMTAQLLRIPEAIAARPQVRFARDLQLADLKESNLILIGGQVADPWLSVFEPELNFVITADVGNTRVINRSPRPGELATYEYQPQNLEHMAYAVVALIPNLDRRGMVLVIEGTSIAGTEAAADFVSDSPQLESLLAPMYKQFGRIPSFEILLESTDLNGTAPRSRILATRINP